MRRKGKMMIFVKKHPVIVTTVLIMVLISCLYSWKQYEELNSGRTMESREHLISKFMDEEWTVISESGTGRLIFCGAESRSEYGLAIFRMKDDGTYSIQKVIHAYHGSGSVLAEVTVRNEDTWYAVAWANNPDVETIELRYRINQKELEPVILTVENLKPVYYENPGNHFRLNMYAHDKYGNEKQIC